MATKTIYKKKTRISPNWQKSNFARGANFFCTFLCLCFVRLQRGTSRNFLVTRFMVTRFMVTRFLFFVAHFHPGGRSNSHFLTAATKLHVVPTTEKGLLCFFSLALALFLVQLRWVSPYFLFFSVFLFLCIPNLWT